MVYFYDGDLTGSDAGNIDGIHNEYSRMRTKMAIILRIVSERDGYASGCADGHES